MCQQNHSLPTQSPQPILPDELIEEILLWLPVKSLLQFKLVSKSWKSLISNPKFVKRHLHRSATNADFAGLRLTTQRHSDDHGEGDDISCSVRSLLHSLSSSTVAEKRVYYRFNEYYAIVGSCNGLLCLAGGRADSYSVRLWNPAMRLTSPDFDLKWYEQAGRYGSPHFGFGYHRISDTYKVVAVIFDKQHLHGSLVKVFSVGDSRWRDIPSFPVVVAGRDYTEHNDGVYLNGSGTLNWVALRNVSDRQGMLWDEDMLWDEVTIDQLVIVSLDLGTETSKQLLMPHGLDELPHVQPTLAVLGDCLCVCHDYKRTHFVVWQMKEFGVENSWTQLVKVSYQGLQTGRLQLEYITLLPFCFTENGDVLIFSKFVNSPATLFECRDNRSEAFGIPITVCWKYPKVYVESLVLPC